ncbi:MAG: L-2-amino-thiazoline-4-carboxylic acid hydrolase [Peptococcaceae bacterium]|jgi:hypothetical protein|nr:L-2-amino-thiazoline-4-carboxylic acid hydrolase [Peptococcaceae bacterium]
MEKQWRGMIRVSHDFFHRWRQAVLEGEGEEKAREMELRFWELVGQGTADAYRRLNPASLGAIVDLMARSSRIMGEEVTTRKSGDECFLVHTGCPWPESYRAAGLGGSCRPGCDRWFAATLANLDAGYAVETLSSLADGDTTCTRRFYAG